MRHPHKTQTTLAQQIDELQRDIFREIDEKILNDGRNGECPLIIAAVIMTQPGQPERLVNYAAEYGDNEATLSMEEFIDRVKRTALLQPGENLRLDMMELETNEIA